MIGVIDYGAGNLRSVENALSALGAECETAASARDIDRADALLLPGVGEFGSAVKELSRRALCGAIKGAAADGVPLLGICLGMQLLFGASEEAPEARGLGILAGRSLRFPDGPGLKVPHTGWNSITPLKESALLSGVRAGSCMYFVHSFFVRCDERADAAAEAFYGSRFDAAVERGNVFGCQFHPEKSGSAGLSILKNFIKISGGK